MKTTHQRWILAILLCVVVLQVETAFAKVSFHISVGSGGFYGPCRPRGYHYRPYYSRYPYHCSVGVWPSYYHYRRPYYSSGVSLYVSDVRPIFERIDRQVVILKEPEPVNVPNQDYWVANTKSNDELFAELRLKKDDLLELVKSPEKELRAKAVDELAGFSFDETVRQAMEKVLLSDPEPDLRVKAAKALGKVSNKLVLPALEQAKAGDPDASVRQEAYKAIILVKGY